MKVILLKDIAKLGKRGEVKDVADAYAIHVLIRKNDAVQATKAELAKWGAKEAAKEKKKETNLNTFSTLIDTLSKTKIIISDKKRDSKGQLFAHVRESDIADAIFSLVAISINPKQIQIPSAIKSLGVFEVEIREGDKKGVIKVEVV